MANPHTLSRRAPGAPALLAACLALALPGCGYVRDYVGGEDNLEPPADLVEFEQTLTVKTLWSRHVGAGVDKQYLKLRPAVVDDRIYAADRTGQVTALDAATGQEVWQTATRTAVSGGPGTGDGMVYVGTSNGEVLALLAESGELEWRARVSSEVLAPPRSMSGVVVARTVDGKLFGLSARDGARLWVYDRTVPILTLRGTSSPALGEGVAVAGFDSGRLVSISLVDGQSQWESRIATPTGRSELERLVDIDADPVIFRDIVYAVTFQGRIAAVDLITGKVLWRRDMSSHAGLGTDRVNIYVTDQQSHVWALDRESSASLWRQQKLQARRVTAPVSYVGYVVVADYDGYVHWLRNDDGQFVARTRVDSDGVIAPPVSNDNAVFIYDRGGNLTAFTVE